MSAQVLRPDGLPSLLIEDRHPKEPCLPYGGGRKGLSPRKGTEGMSLVRHGVGVGATVGGSSLKGSEVESSHYRVSGGGGGKGRGEPVVTWGRLIQAPGC
jgi:hypothetical protein